MIAVPFELPSTRGPGSERALLRDALKALRQGKSDETRALRVLDDYARHEMQGGEWRLPWTSTRQKTLLNAEDERRMVTIASALLLSRLAEYGASTSDYKKANAHLGQAVKMLQGLSGTSTHKDLSHDTVVAITCSYSGIAHELLLRKLLAANEPISRANATVHARVAMYAHDRYSCASQICPRALKSWVEEHRSYCLAACHLFSGREQLALNNAGAAIAHFQAAQRNSTIAKETTDLLAEATSANKLVSFQAVPDVNSLTLPAGRCVINFNSEYF